MRICGVGGVSASRPAFLFRQAVMEVVTKTQDLAKDAVDWIHERRRARAAHSALENHDRYKSAK